MIDPEALAREFEAAVGRSPRLYRAPAHASTIGSHIDLAPTIAELAGFESATDWQGRSLFDAEHPPRAYFYVAEDSFTSGFASGE